MRDALAYEWVRIRTVRSTYWLLGATVLVGLVVAVAVGLGSRGQSLGADGLGLALTVGVALVPPPVTAVLLGMLGVLAVGHEYRHQTIQPTLTALPHRSALVAAKLVVVSAVCLATGVVTVLLDLAVVAALRGGDVDLSAPLPAALVGYVLLLGLWGALGVALTLLLRNVVVVVVVLLLTPLLVEQIISGLTFLPQLEWLRPAVRFLPFTAGSQLAESFAFTPEEIGPGPQPLARWENGAVFTTFVVLVLAPAWALFERRDA